MVGVNKVLAGCFCMGACMPTDSGPCARSLYNNTKTPGQLQPSATYYLFKTGIEPKWEDPTNAHGGCWTASLNRGANKAQLDAWWLNSVGRGADVTVTWAPAWPHCARNAARGRRARVCVCVQCAGVCWSVHGAPG